MIEIGEEVATAVLERAIARGWMEEGAPIEVWVSSSAIRTISYDLGQFELGVTFRDGSHYTYSSVPPQVAVEFLGASSKGRYFNDNIRNEYGF